MKRAAEIFRDYYVLIVVGLIVLLALAGCTTHTVEREVPVPGPTATVTQTVTKVVPSPSPYVEIPKSCQDAIYAADDLYNATVNGIATAGDRKQLADVYDRARERCRKWIY